MGVLDDLKDDLNSYLKKNNIVGKKVPFECRFPNIRIEDFEVYKVDTQYGAIKFECKGRRLIRGSRTINVKLLFVDDQGNLILKADSKIFKDYNRNSADALRGTCKLYSKDIQKLEKLDKVVISEI